MQLSDQNNAPEYENLSKQTFILNLPFTNEAWNEQQQCTLQLCYVNLVLYSTGFDLMHVPNFYGICCLLISCLGH